MHPSALPARASRLVLFLPFGAGPTSLFFGSSGLNAQRNILNCVEPAAKKEERKSNGVRWGKRGQESREKHQGREGDEGIFKQAERSLCDFAV